LALIERWNGSTWSIQHTPRVHERQPSLFDVSCTSSRACEAVGEAGYFDGPVLAEGWKGSVWSIDPTRDVPNPSDASIDAISCVSPTFCAGVGLYYDKALGVNESLALGWNGVIWSRQRGVPPPSPDRDQLLSGVSCTSSSNCIAVGTATKPNSMSGGPGFAIRWNGRSWLPTSDRALRVDNAPYAVSCVSPTDCTAVGGQDGSFAAVWDGMRWSSEQIPHGLFSPSLFAVSCPSTSRCVATSGGPLVEVGP
jgi:hypothetical protein